MEVATWPGQTTTVAVRGDGVDTPEIRGSKCPEEHAAAIEARDFVRAWVAEGPVFVYNVRPGMFAGRMLGSTIRIDGRFLKDDLIAAGLARPYDGGKRQGGAGSRGARLPPSVSPFLWCLLAALSLPPRTTTSRSPSRP